MTRSTASTCLAAAILFASTSCSEQQGTTEPATPRQLPESAAPARSTPPQEASGLAEALESARRACDLRAIDVVVSEARQATEAAPDNAGTWRVLAEAHLERAQQRTHLRGIKVGEPLFAELPEELEGDLEAGIEAVAAARARGDDSGALFRIEAGLLSQRITGLSSALRYSGDISKALTAAEQRDADDPKLQVALGLRKLLAPRLLGHDAEQARSHFERAVQNGGDERSAVFAGMATYLQEKRGEAVQWLERAVAANPSNTFAQAVLARLRRGDPEPFGRDVTAAEAAALKQR